MACASHDYRLSLLLQVQELSDLAGRFIPIQERHVAVHQDQLVPVVALVRVVAFLHHLHCLFAVVSDAA